MVFRTSTVQTRIVAGLAASVLLAGFAASPAAADPAQFPWLQGNGKGARAGTVGQVAREVNRGRGHDREHGPDHGSRPAPPPPGYGTPRPVPPPQYTGGTVNHVYTYNYSYNYQASPYRYAYGPYVYARSYAYPVYIMPYPAQPYPVYGSQPAQQQVYCRDGYAPAPRAGSSQTGGAIVGGVIGAAVGSQLGKGTGKLAAVGVGTLIGALIGADMGRSVDAVDRTYATGSMGQALEATPTCTTVTWNNPQTGSYGSITPVNTYEAAPGRYCREYQQQVVIGGQVENAYGTACRQPDGSWEIVAE